MADDDAGLDQIEHYLLNAPILDRSAFHAHGAHRSELFILSGGVGALCKPEDGIGEGRIAVTREVAAWRIARILGWTDLMSATVLREIDPGRVASLTVMWPEPMPDAAPAIAGFPDEDVWRAAVFDTLVRNGDRGGHNWLAVPKPPGTSRLKLIDHGYAFDEARNPNSTFVDLKRGQDVPDELAEDVNERLVQHLPTAELEGLIGADEQTRLIQRAEHLAHSRRVGE